ncbi:MULTISPECIES: hypothetical protein [Rhizobium]|uniref:hypothetical protein n=1 Tax=Rhizobium TaxID=379 RepID=UPI0023615423|nr:hypothetical protein [Rhizobium sp. MJ37]MDC9832003.1 hypothetical protein [Rhizobium sp. MJ37]
MIEEMSKPVVIEGFGKMRQIADAFGRKGLVFAISHQTLLADTAALAQHESEGLL